MALLTLSGKESVSGTFANGGTITQQSAGPHCSNQRYLVSDSLTNVSIGGATGGTGTFVVTLVHYRIFIPFVGCVTYSASVSGSVALSI